MTIDDKIIFWDFVNEYAESCGGDISDENCSDRRMDAVAALETFMNYTEGSGFDDIPLITFTVNGKERQEEYWDGTIFYEDLVNIIGGNPETLYTITVHNPNGMDFSLTRGEFCELNDGAVFNVYDTSKA